MSIAIRDATPSDLEFVVASFLDSYKTAHAAGLITIKHWHSLMGGEFADILKRPGMRTVVACNPDESDRRLDVHGWIASERHDTEPPMPIAAAGGES